MACEGPAFTRSFLQLHRRELVEPGPELSQLEYPNAVLNAYLVLVLAFLVFLLAGCISLAFFMGMRFFVNSLEEDMAELERSGLEDSPSPTASTSEPEYPKVSVLKQFLELAEGSPKTVALQTVGGETVTRRQLISCAARCAQLLEGHQDELVALYLAGPELVAAILGTWLAMAAWAPLDKRSPQQRLREVVKQMRPAVVLCDDDAAFLDLNLPIIHAQQLRFDEATLSVAYTENLQRVAQVIFTSGSTGTPKGVVYTHERLAHSTHFFAEQCEVTSSTRILQKTPPIWAVFRHEVYPTLCRGGLMIYPEPDKMADPLHLAEVINSWKVSLLISTPTILELLLDTGGSMGSLRRAVCMGEPLSCALARRVTDMGVTLMNFYGSTETENTVFTVPPVVKSGKGLVPAGRPQPHVRVHLLKPGSLDEAQDGQEGEICFGGIISSGYWQRPELTAASFVEHPTLGRLYRSGDLGVWRHGQLVVLGRQDRQVKIRGARVELQEVELLLAPLASECACVAAKGEHHLQIVAFCTGDAVELQRKAESFMPPQLLPSFFCPVETMPRLGNGKVALAKLQELASDALRKQSTETQPVLDSLGMLQNLTKSQIEEDKWVQNQQAFWCLVVMQQHFLIMGYKVTPTLTNAWWITADLCHFRDMIAFLMLLGFTDSRQLPALGTREAAVFISCLFVLLVYRPVFAIAKGQQVDPFPNYEWFLYTYLWCRLLLVSLRKLPAACQLLVLGTFAAAPDDFVWLRLPLQLRLDLAQRTPFDSKSAKFVVCFLPLCYFLGYHGTKAGFVTWCQKIMRKMCAQSDLDERHLRASLSVSCWAAYFALCSFYGHYPQLTFLEPYTYQRGLQAVFKEHGDHTVSWQYMTHPSLWRFAALWVAEALTLLLPSLLVAGGMANWTWHFKTMGTTTFGIYVSHVPLCYAPFMQYVLALLAQINSGSEVMDIVMILAFAISCCLLFAHSFGAAFHHALVALLKGLASLCQLSQSSQSSKC